MVCGRQDVQFVFGRSCFKQMKLCIRTIVACKFKFIWPEKQLIVPQLQEFGPLRKKEKGILVWLHASAFTNTTVRKNQCLLK
mmetsp:Transcript_11350/g.27934  ORF Transcript_11350/g.27934 Transcript_11350/m.27934 type:complete len:82 (-) Transcript_11350:76-321(-)